MKYTADRPFADPEKAARRLIQHAHAFKPVQDGRIYVEKIHGPFLFGDKADACGVCGRPRARHRTRLAGIARQWDLREVHPSRCRSVRVGPYLNVQPLYVTTNQAAISRFSA